MLFRIILSDFSYFPQYAESSAYAYTKESFPYENIGSTWCYTNEINPREYTAPPPPVNTI